MTKNLNRKISAKNLVTFGLRLWMKNFNIIGVH